MRSLVKYLVLFLVLLAGCSVNYNYRDIVADIGYSGTASISVAVHDQRPYVLSGNKDPDFVGLVRGGFGNPSSRATINGRPLAEDMAGVIADSLAKKGYKAIAVNVLHSMNLASVLDALKTAKTDRMILVTQNEWKTDANPYKDVTLFYDMKLSVYGNDAGLRAEKAIKGEDNLGGDFWGPAAYARKVAPEAFKRKIEELLNSAEITKALQ